MVTGGPHPNVESSRRGEFAAGRACARAALASLGAEPIGIPMQADRSPAWPRGFVGAISHSSGYCVAAVGSSSRFLGIGIDAEAIGAVERDVWDVVFVPREIRLLETLPLERQRLAATIVFSAKESFYKCRSTTQHLDFTDVEIVVCESRFSVRASGTNPARSRSSLLASGTFAIEDNRVLTGIAISR